MKKDKPKKKERAKKYEHKLAVKGLFPTFSRLSRKTRKKRKSHSDFHEF